ncbi:hypothetical protein D3C71_1289500 [compost metagenome]
MDGRPVAFQAGVGLEKESLRTTEKDLDERLAGCFRDKEFVIAAGVFEVAGV